MTWRKEGGEGGDGLVVEAIEGNSVFWFKGGIKFLVGKKIIKNNFGGLIEGLGRDKGGKVFFEAEGVNVIIEVERWGSDSWLKFSLNLMVDLGGSVGTREDKGREDRETDDKGEKRFVETINDGLVFERHGIILTCGI